MQHSYLLSVISFGKLISLVVRNKGVSLRFLGRFLFLLQGSIWASVFKIVEKIKIKRSSILKEHKNGPVFIVGHWRTGSTFLHQLLALDKQFVTPSVVKVSVPDSFLVSQKYFRKIMSKVIGQKRPMDNVKLGPDEPQEDEYAILKMVKNTALEKLFFRKKCNDDFLHDLIVFMENEKISVKWKNAFSLFASKLVYNNDSIALFKNPFHSFRIKELKELFPNAKFIHIYRNPVDVIPSTIKMWNIVGRQNLLSGKWTDVSYESAINMYNSLWLALKEQVKEIDKNSFAEIRFEELEENTVESIKQLYNKLNLKYSVEFDNNIKDFLLSLKSYEKNKHILDKEIIDLIQKGCEG
jgi:omega-hydroxy-beta-dihydromenaquinone-9 sulfotransferase